MTNLDRLINDEYDYLLGVARNIVGRGSNMIKEDATDLLHHCFVLFNNRPDILQKPVAEIKKMLIITMRNQWWWDDSFKKSHGIKEIEVLNPEHLLFDFEWEKNTEIMHEDVPDNFKSLVKHLFDIGLTQKQIEKVIAIYVVHPQLDLPEKLLFELYFIEGKSIRQISEEKKVSNRFVFETLKKLKEKLRVECDKIIK